MDSDVAISIVLPVYNEEEGIAGVVAEVFAAVQAAGLTAVEVLAVNDGSTDATERILKELAVRCAGLRVISLRPNAGQSAAMVTGFRRARGKVVVTMDADGQNDPADIAACVTALADCDCCFGYRARRQDRWSRRWGSRFANGVRNRVLGEAIVDTGCSLKAFKAEFLADLPLWDGVHRFLGSMVVMRGARIRQIPVNHRPRVKGQSKYTNLGRLKRTVWDLLAVRWMKARCRAFSVEEGTA